jgi:hypothetical protein
LLIAIFSSVSKVRFMITKIFIGNPPRKKYCPVQQA